MTIFTENIGLKFFMQQFSSENTRKPQISLASEAQFQTLLEELTIMFPHLRIYDPPLLCQILNMMTSLWLVISDWSVFFLTNQKERVSCSLQSNLLTSSADSAKKNPRVFASILTFGPGLMQMLLSEPSSARDSTAISNNFSLRKQALKETQSKYTSKRRTNSQRPNKTPHKSQSIHTYKP